MLVVMIALETASLTQVSIVPCKRVLACRKPIKNIFSASTVAVGNLCMTVEQRCPALNIYSIV